MKKEKLLENEMISINELQNKIAQEHESLVLETSKAKQLEDQVSSDFTKINALRGQLSNREEKYVLKQEEIMREKQITADKLVGNEKIAALEHRQLEVQLLHQTQETARHEQELLTHIKDKEIAAVIEKQRLLEQMTLKDVAYRDKMEKEAEKFRSELEKSEKKSIEIENKWHEREQRDRSDSEHVRDSMKLEMAREGEKIALAASSQVRMAEQHAHELEMQIRELRNRAPSIEHDARDLQHIAKLEQQLSDAQQARESVPIHDTSDLQHIAKLEQQLLDAQQAREAAPTHDTSDLQHIAQLEQKLLDAQQSRSQAETAKTATLHPLPPPSPPLPSTTITHDSTDLSRISQLEERIQGLQLQKQQALHSAQVTDLQRQLELEQQKNNSNNNHSDELTIEISGGGHSPSYRNSNSNSDYNNSNSNSKLSGSGSGMGSSPIISTAGVSVFSSPPNDTNTNTNTSTNTWGGNSSSGRLKGVVESAKKFIHSHSGTSTHTSHSGSGDERGRGAVSFMDNNNRDNRVGKKATTGQVITQHAGYGSSNPSSFSSSSRVSVNNVNNIRPGKEANFIHSERVTTARLLNIFERFLTYKREIASHHHESAREKASADRQRRYRNMNMFIHHDDDLEGTNAGHLSPNATSTNAKTNTNTKYDWEDFDPDASIDDATGGAKSKFDSDRERTSQEPENRQAHSAALMFLQVSLSLRFKSLFVYNVSILFHGGCCIRQL